MSVVEQCRLLEMADLDDAVETQARAFANDPLWVHLLPDRERRMKYEYKVFRPLIHLNIGNRQAYGVAVSGASPVRGIALWSMPDNPPASPDAMLASGLLGLLFTPFIIHVLRARRVFAQFADLHKKYAPGPHYYLDTLAVHPDAQGKGLASRLVRPVLAKAAAEGVGVYLETVTPGNVTLYEHFGFNMMEARQITGTGLTVWSFYRAPDKLEATKNAGLDLAF